jgi:hypothetical protein
VQIVAIGSGERGGRNHSDEFAAGDFNAFFAATAGDGFENDVHGRDPEVYKVNGHLDLAA